MEKLNKVTQDKILEAGWITPACLSNAFSQLIRDMDTSITVGVIRKDLVMNRIDNFKMELINRCAKNLEREISREEQLNIGRNNKVSPAAQRRENEAQPIFRPARPDRLGSGDPE